MPVDTHAMAASKSQKNWEKARHRYADMCQPEETQSTSTEATQPDDDCSDLAYPKA